MTTRRSQGSLTSDSFKILLVNLLCLLVTWQSLRFNVIGTILHRHVTVFA